MFRPLIINRKVINTKQQVIIVGGGFAGLNLVKELDKNKYQITLIDRNNYHSFPPLFYQVASSGLEPASVSFPFRKEFRKMKSVRFCMGELQNVNAAEKYIDTTAGRFSYDHLVLSAGCTSNFFGKDYLADYVYTLKSTSESISLRNQVLAALETASTCTDAENRLAWLNFVVVGGGPTGVEVAGALGEMKKYILPREYPDLDPSEVHVILSEGSDRLLRTMSAESSKKALLYLQQLEVEVQLCSVLSEYDGKHILLADGSQLNARTVIWTAGITGEKIPGINREIVSRSGRLLTDQYNQVSGYDHIYALGDLSYMVTPEYPQGHPQLAQVAIQQAKTLAGNLNAGVFTRPFVYKDKGSMATVGRNRAVVDLPYAHFQGKMAWFVWMFVHLLSLLGMKNKLFTFINWVWNYFTYDVSLRLLIRPALHGGKNKEVKEAAEG